MIEVCDVLPPQVSDDKSFLTHCLSLSCAVSDGVKSVATKITFSEIALQIDNWHL